MDNPFTPLCRDIWSREAPEETVQLLSPLLEGWSAPGRHYHTPQHLYEMLVDWNTVRAHSLHPNELFMAIWFHDFVYNPRRQDNEAQSAQMATQLLSDVGWSAPDCQRVAEMVLRTRGHLDPQTPDEALLLDLDLRILGSSKERFCEYENQIHQEYAWVPEDLYRQERSKVLRHFQEASSLFQTSEFQMRYTSLARVNLAYALQSLAPTTASILSSPPHANAVAETPLPLDKDLGQRRPTTSQKR